MPQRGCRQQLGGCRGRGAAEGFEVNRFSFKFGPLSTGYRSLAASVGSAAMSASGRCLYYATSQKPTAVTHAAVGSLCSAGALNLVLGLSSRLEVYAVTAEGLALVHQEALHGRIATMLLVKPAGRDRAQLMLTTERCHFMVLEWSQAEAALKTVAYGNLQVRQLGCSCCRAGRQQSRLCRPKQPLGCSRTKAAPARTLPLTRLPLSPNPSLLLPCCSHPLRHLLRVLRLWWAAGQPREASRVWPACPL